MTNLIGEEANDWKRLAAEPETLALWLYGKAQVRPGRKMGHVNRLQPATVTCARHGPATWEAMRRPLRADHRKASANNGPPTRQAPIRWAFARAKAQRR